MFEMKPKSEANPANSNGDSSKTTKIPLPSGSLLIMMGETQRDWVHRVPREYHDRGLRFNLTFRKTHEAN